MSALASATQFASLQAKCKDDTLSELALTALQPQYQLSSTFPSITTIRNAIYSSSSPNLITNKTTSPPLPLLIASNQATTTQRAFWRTCEERAMFEIYSDTLITKLNNYIHSRLQQINPTNINDKPIMILEIGAGDGKLTQALQAKQLSTSLLTFQATDIHPPSTSKSIVKRMNARRAIIKYQPTIIICSWMPSGIDFTGEIRLSKDCQEYILIGPPNTSTSGDAWATWGILSQELIDDYGLDKNAIKPYLADEWHRCELPELNKCTFCRFDVNGSEVGFSKVTSFRKGVFIDDRIVVVPVLPMPLHDMSIHDLLIYQKQWMNAIRGRGSNVEAPLLDLNQKPVQIKSSTETDIETKTIQPRNSIDGYNVTQIGSNGSTWSTRDIRRAKGWLDVTAPTNLIYLNTSSQSTKRSNNNFQAEIFCKPKRSGNQAGLYMYKNAKCWIKLVIEDTGDVDNHVNIVFAHQNLEENDIQQQPFVLGKISLGCKVKYCGQCYLRLEIVDGVVYGYYKMSKESDWRRVTRGCGWLTLKEMENGDGEVVNCLKNEDERGKVVCECNIFDDWKAVLLSEQWDDEEETVIEFKGIRVNCELGGVE